MSNRELLKELQQKQKELRLSSINSDKVQDVMTMKDSYVRFENLKSFENSVIKLLAAIQLDIDTLKSRSQTLIEDASIAIDEKLDEIKTGVLDGVESSVSEILDTKMSVHKLETEKEIIKFENSIDGRLVDTKDSLETKVEKIDKRVLGIHDDVDSEIEKLRQELTKYLNGVSDDLQTSVKSMKEEELHSLRQTMFKLNEQFNSLKGASKQQILKTKSDLETSIDEKSYNLKSELESKLDSIKTDLIKIGSLIPDGLSTKVESIDSISTIINDIKAELGGKLTTLENELLNSITDIEELKNRPPGELPEGFIEQINSMVVQRSVSIPVTIDQGGTGATTLAQAQANLGITSTSPGGSNTQVQFNDSSTFGGDSGLVYNKTTDVLTSGGVNITGLTASLPVVTDSSKNLASVSYATLAGSLDHNSLTNLTTGDVHTHYALLAGRSGGQTLIGSTVTAQNLTLRPNSANTTTGSIIINGPTFKGTTNQATDFGTSALRFNDMNFAGLKGWRDATSVGTATVTYQNFANGCLLTANDTAGTSCTATVGQTNFPAFAVGAITSTGAVATDTATMNATGNAALAFANAANFFSAAGSNEAIVNSIYDNTINMATAYNGFGNNCSATTDASGSASIIMGIGGTYNSTNSTMLMSSLNTGSLLIGSSLITDDTGSSISMLSSGVGSTVIGATNIDTFSVSSTISMGAGGNGSLTSGYASISGGDATSSATLSAGAAGSMVQGAVVVTATGVTGSISTGGTGGALARGYVSRGIITATNQGSFASGFSNSTANTGGLSATGLAAVVLGRTIGSGLILSSGNASFVSGNQGAGGSANITGSGAGSFTCFQSTGTGAVTNSGAGSIAVFNHASTATITVSSAGSGFFGRANSSGNVSVTTGAGNFAFGDAGTTGISATGSINCVQFGQGANTTASSVKFGATVMIDHGNTRVGIGQTTPTAKLHLAAGSTAASSAPIKLTSGTNMTTAEAGAIEFTTDDFFATITTGAARKAFVLDDGARLTSTKIPVATTNGRLIDTSFYSDGSDNWWVGTGTGLPYGGAYGYDIAWSQASAAQNTWYLVSDTDMNDGPLNLLTHDGNGKLTVTKAGTYKIDMSISMSCSAANKLLEYGISINGASPAMYQREFFNSASSDLQHASLSRIITLTANQTIELAIRTVSTGTPNIGVNNLSMNAIMVGG